MFPIFYLLLFCDEEAMKKFFFRCILYVLIVSIRSQASNVVLDNFLSDSQNKGWKILYLQGNEIRVWEPLRQESEPLSSKGEYIYNTPPNEVLQGFSLAFANSKALIAKDAIVGDQGQIMFIDRNSGEEIIIYNGSAPKSPVLSPDERYIAFLSEGNFYTDYSLYSLFLLDLQSRNLTKIVSNEIMPGGSYNANISWLDNQTVVYSNHDGEIYLLNLHTKERTFVITGYDPLCSPEGQRILFKKHQYKPYRPFIYRFRDNQVEAIKLSNVYNAIWAPNGKFLLVVKMNNAFLSTNEWKKQVIVFDIESQKTAPLFTYEGYEYLDCK